VQASPIRPPFKSSAISVAEGCLASHAPAGSCSGVTVFTTHKHKMRSWADQKEADQVCRL
jgi:hypothetical protein